MKTNEIIAGLRKLCGQGSEYRRTVCRLAADTLEAQQKRIEELEAEGCFEDGRCHALGNCEHKIVTNADRIRAMSDEELAAAIWAAFNDNDYLGGQFCDGKAGCLLDCGDFDCDDSKEKACVLRWLQQPVKGE